VVDPLALVRSGWWVAVAGVIFAALVLWLAVSTPGVRDGAVGDGHDPASYGFDLVPSTVPAHAIAAAGMPRDGLEVLDRPDFLTTAEVTARNEEGRGKFLLAIDRVVGVAVKGEARAYPVRFMRWHEVVNDVIGGRPVLVTYSPLCDAAVVADRSLDDGVLEFGFSGLLYNSNPLLYDRRPDSAASSLWSQLDGRAVAGPAAAAGRSLALHHAALTTWGQWSDHHPDTLVLAPLERLKRLYKRDPYHSYFGSDVLRFPVEPLPPADGPAVKDRVLILTVHGRDTVLSLAGIAADAGSERGTWSTTVDDVPVTVHYDAMIGAAQVEWPDQVDAEVASRQAFWFAWYSHHPTTPPPLPRVQR
jgi:hypothetical protein